MDIMRRVVGYHLLKDMSIPEAKYVFTGIVYKLPFYNVILGKF